MKLSDILRGDPLPALQPSASEHVPAVLGLHALTETMYLLALPFLGLVSTKHVEHLSSSSDFIG